MKLAYESIIDTVNLVALECSMSVDFREEGKPKYPVQSTQSIAPALKRRSLVPVGEPFFSSVLNSANSHLEF